MSSAAPLSGLRVLDLGHNITAPVATTMLRAMGAEVIKVERPGTGDVSRSGPPYYGERGFTYTKQSDDEISVSFMKRNRGKKAVVLDFKDSADRQRLLGLCSTADVVLENFRPGVLDKLGLSFGEMSAVNDQLILCSVSGWGDSDKYGSWLAYDGIIQAFTGIMERTGFPENGPVKSGFPVADNLGALFSTIGVLGALEERRRTGHGRHVKISMVDCVLFMMWDDPLDYFASRNLSPRSGNGNRRSAPWNMYPAADGNVFICVHSDSQWTALCDVIGVDAMDDRFATSDRRIANEDDVNEAVAAWTASMTKEDAALRLQQAGVPCSPVRTPVEVLRDPDIASRIFRPVRHPLLGQLPEVNCAAFPIRFGDEDLIDAPGPAFGQHQEMVLGSTTP